MNKKAPSNANSLNYFKSVGFTVTINHFRRVFNYDENASKWKFEIVPDGEWRKNARESFYFSNGPEEKGGATELTLTRGTEQYKVRAECYVKDSFCRRLGVRACLDKLDKIFAN
jgi:hypothetical protein